MSMALSSDVLNCLVYAKRYKVVYLDDPGYLYLDIESDTQTRCVPNVDETFL